MAVEKRSVSFRPETIESILKFSINENAKSIEEINLSGAIGDIVGIMDNLVERTRLEMKNYLTVEEAYYIIDSLNGVLWSETIPFKTQLLIGLEDSRYTRNPVSDMEVDLDKLLDKINKLNEYQAFVLIVNISEFWREAKGKNMLSTIRRIFKIG